MSLGDGPVEGEGLNSAVSNHGDETVADLSRGAVVRWQGPIERHVATIAVAGEDARLAGPTLPDRPRALAGNVLEVLPYDEIVGQDGKGNIHVRDGGFAVVLDEDDHEVIASQDIRGHGMAVWLAYVEHELGWEIVHDRYSAVLEEEQQ